MQSSAMGRRHAPYSRCCVVSAIIGLASVFVSLGIHTAVRAEEAAPLADQCAGVPPALNVGARVPLVFTYFYYWYSEESLTDPQLAQRPPMNTPFHWSDPAWHARELEDMVNAGVDVVLPVYWGSREDWSRGGLDALVEARTARLQAGLPAPSLGLFFDTNLLSLVVAERPELADLTDEAGIEFLVDEMMAFFDRAPACHRLSIDSQPVIFVWRPDTEDGAQLTFRGDILTELGDRLEARLGARPIIVRERTWDVRAAELGVTLDPGPVFGWGAALDGPLVEQQTVAVGAGYDDRHLPGRIGYQRDRDGGEALRRDLRVATLSGAPWLLLETWNEQWESTALARTEEHDGLYIDVLAQELPFFRSFRDHLPRDAWVDLGSGAESYLQLLAAASEERGERMEFGRIRGSRPYFEAQEGAAYFHFGLPPRLRPHGIRSASVEVEYLDSGSGFFRLQYESEPDDETGEVYTESEPVRITNSGQWLRHRFTLPNVRFQSHQYGGYGDFRIQDLPGEGEVPHAFSLVILRTAPGERPVLVQPATLTSLRGSLARRLDLRWTEVPGAVEYRLEVARADGQSWASEWAGDQPDSCWSAGPATLATRTTACALHGTERWAAGLYRWRVEALGADGAIIGTPSDWAYLVRR